MSESVSDQPKPESQRHSTDEDIFAQVERWMALIREIILEQAKT